jgi:hypothetical protein
MLHVIPIAKKRIGSHSAAADAAAVAATGTTSCRADNAGIAALTTPASARQ